MFYGQNQRVESAYFLEEGAKVEVGYNVQEYLTKAVENEKLIEMNEDEKKMLRV